MVVCGVKYSGSIIGCVLETTAKDVGVCCYGIIFPHHAVYAELVIFRTKHLRKFMVTGTGIKRLIVIRKAEQEFKCDIFMQHHIGFAVCNSAGNVSAGIKFHFGGDIRQSFFTNRILGYRIKMRFQEKFTKFRQFDSRLNDIRVYHHRFKRHERHPPLIQHGTGAVMELSCETSDTTADNVHAIWDNNAVYGRNI